MAASGAISVQYLQSEHQHADILTKAICRASFERHRDFLLGRGLVSIFSWFSSGYYYLRQALIVGSSISFYQYPPCQCLGLLVDVFREGVRYSCHNECTTGSCTRDTIG